MTNNIGATGDPKFKPKPNPEAKAQRQKDMAKGIMASLVEATDSPREACKILMTAIGGVISMGGLKFGKKVETYTYKELEVMLRTIVKTSFKTQRKRLKKEKQIKFTNKTVHIKSDNNGRIW